VDAEDLGALSADLSEFAVICRICDELFERKVGSLESNYLRLTLDDQFKHLDVSKRRSLLFHLKDLVQRWGYLLTEKGGKNHPS
jgi:hypothetical protein